MSYESWEEQGTRKAYDKVERLRRELRLAEAELAVARAKEEIAKGEEEGK